MGIMVNHYSYDAAGQRRSETIMNGSVPVTRALDAEGRLTGVAENAGGTGPYTSTIGYNQNDLVTGVHVPGGVAEQAGYDAASRLISVTATGPNTGSGATTLNSAYGYDALSRLTALTTTVNGAITSTLFQHDAQGRLTQWSGQVNGPETWSYDGNGNIITNTEDIGGMQRTSVYTYSPSVPNEQLQGHTDPTAWASNTARTTTTGTRRTSPARTPSPATITLTCASPMTARRGPLRSPHCKTASPLR